MPDENTQTTQRQINTNPQSNIGGNNPLGGQPSTNPPQVGQITARAPTPTNPPDPGNLNPTVQPQASNISQQPTGNIGPESVITPPSAPKKYNVKKIAATILTILLLIGSVAAGVILVQRQQEIREKADVGDSCGGWWDCDYGERCEGNICQAGCGNICVPNCGCNYDNSCSGTHPPSWSPGCDIPDSPGRVINCGSPRTIDICRGRRTDGNCQRCDKPDGSLACPGDPVKSGNCDYSCSCFTPDDPGWQTCFEYGVGHTPSDGYDYNDGTIFECRNTQLDIMVDGRNVWNCTSEDGRDYDECVTLTPTPSPTPTPTQLVYCITKTTSINTERPLGQIQPGDEITYQIDIGPPELTNTNYTILDTIPSEITKIEILSFPQTLDSDSCSIAGLEISCDLSTTGSITYRGTVGNTQRGTTLTNITAVTNNDGSVSYCGTNLTYPLICDDDCLENGWSGPISLDSLPGSGDFQSQSAFIYPNNQKLHQGFWRGNQGWTRTVPIVNNEPDWNNAPDWSGPININNFPGSGDFQSQSAFIYLHGQRLFQSFWQGNEEWNRTIPIKSDGTPDWDNPIGCLCETGTVCSDNICQLPECVDKPCTCSLGGGLCQEIRAYSVDGDITNSANWTRLQADDLASLKAGNTIYFTVVGWEDNPTGDFIEARFTINGVEDQDPVDTIKPSAADDTLEVTEYYREYTIPDDVESFTINAQVHHETLGWF
jgi:hypothetical protein